MKKCIYTVITAGYEKLISPDLVSDDWDYVAFLDGDAESDFWQKRLFKPRISGVKGSREPKILFHEFLPEYDVTIYIDANYKIVGDLNQLLSFTYISGCHYAFAHSERSCVYNEADAVIAKKKDSGGIVGEWVGKLKAMDYPKNYGLYENGIMIRDRYIPRETYVIWDTLTRLYTYRDQLTFMPSVWMRPIKMSAIDPKLKTDFFQLIPHRDNR